MSLLFRQLNRIRYDLTRPVFLKRMAWVILLWVVALGIIYVNISYLRANYADAVVVDDLLFDLIPETPAFITIAEITSATQILLMVFIFWKRRFKGVPELFFLLGVMYILRSYVILLTPLGQIHPPSETFPESHFLAQTFYHGMFFSGHTASAFIQVFYIKGERLRPVVFVLATIQAFSLIASHSHYSIDIVGAIFVAYFMTHYDFMQLVPKRLRHISWMPWYEAYAGIHAQADAIIKGAEHPADPTQTEQPDYVNEPLLD